MLFKLLVTSSNRVVYFKPKERDFIMGVTIIQKSTGRVPTSTRADVPVFALFRYTDTAGKAKGATFANYGKGDKLGKYFSVATDGDKRGSLSSNANGSKPVVIVGSFTVEAYLAATKDHSTVSRSAISAGDVFQVPLSRHAKATGKPALYLNLGNVANDTKTLSFNLNTNKLAIGTKLTGAVKRVGDSAIASAVAA